jgi:flavin reductase (DIM6/NTAB) family NADH-FMN oxidoreductase RutF
MVVGSFTSVSLDPPLVAFLPGKQSRTWPRIQAAGSFCVNVLSAEQESVTHAMMSRTGDKFAGLQWKPSASTGAPALTSAVAWIDCRIEQVIDAGDHWMVIGAVADLDIGDPKTPLLFFRGGYGRFESGSRVAGEMEFGGARMLRALDRVRPGMERLSTELGCECVAAARVAAEIALIASAGHARGWDLPSRVGERVPAVAPFGRSIMAWADKSTIDRWLTQVSDPEQASEHRQMLQVIRERGYSVTIRPEQPTAVPDGAGDTRSDLGTVLDPGPELLAAGSSGSPVSVAVPVLDQSGQPLFALALYGFESPGATTDVGYLAARLREIAKAAGPAPTIALPASSLTC